MRRGAGFQFQPAALAMVAIALSAQGMAQTLPNLTATPASVAFTYTIGATTLPNAQTVTIKSSVTSTQLNCTLAISPAAPWLIVSPLSGKTQFSLSVRVNPTSLPAGVQSTAIVITSAGAANSPISVPVTLTVRNPAPTMTATPGSLTFNYQTDGSAPADQTMAVTTSGEPLSFTAAVGGAAWLSVAPTSGISMLGSPASLTVTADPTNLLPGTFTGKITLTSANAVNKTLVINVTLTVSPGTAALTSVWPPDVAVGSPDTTITIFGNHLFPSSVAHVDATEITTTWVATTALLAVIPSSLLTSQGTLSITVTNAPQPASNAVNWTVTAPGPRIWSVVNAASFASGSPNPVIAPGEIVTVFGSGLGAVAGVTAAPSGGAYPTSLGTSPEITTLEVEVTSGSWVAAPLIYADANQINAVMPFNMTPAAGMNLRATYNGVTSATFAVDGVAAAPGIFTVDASGQGQAAVFNYNSTTGAMTLNKASNAAARGSTIVIFLTGGGVTNPLPSPEGQVIPLTTPYPTLVGTTTVTVGSETVAADYAGAVPTAVAGLTQVNAVIPTASITGKSVPLYVTVGGRTSPAGVTIAVK